MLLIGVLVITLLLAVALFAFRYEQQRASLEAQLPEQTPALPAIDAAATALFACFINVGQGDCLFFRSPDGRTLLIDTGPEGCFETIQAQLDAFAVTHLDVLFLTQYQPEHIGNLQEILDHYTVGALYIPPDSNGSTEAARLLETLESNNIAPLSLYAAANTCIPWSSDCELRVLSPLRVPYTQSSDTGYILRIQYGKTAVFCAGDAGELAERVMVKAFRNFYIRASILKVGNHGASGSTGDKLLGAVRPDVAVISAGADHDPMLPDQDVLARLFAYDITVYRTDRDGTMCFLLDGTSVQMLE